MNYEITESFVSEQSSNKKPFLLLILSIVCIPAAYVYLAAIFMKNLINRELNLKTKNTLYILVYAYASIGLIFSDYKLISAVYVVIMMLCLYSYAIFNSLADPEVINMLSKLVLRVSLVVFILGIIQYFNPGFAMPSKWVDTGEYGLSKRVYSTFFNPNVFGFYINIIILLTIERLDVNRINLNFFVIVSGLICLILTFSRTSWISLIAALIAASLFNKKYIKFALMISIVIFGTDTLLGIGRADPLKAIEDSSFLYRLEIWKACIEIIKDNLVTGIGFGTLFKHVGSYSTVVSTNIEHSHNLYIQIIMETGILGFTLFFSLIITILNNFKKKLYDEKNNMWITAFAVFIMTMVHGLVDSVALTPQIMMILAIYAGTLRTMNSEK